MVLDARDQLHGGVDDELSLEEKGTVYNEMSSTFERPWGRFWQALTIAQYGAGHPLTRSAGGLPDEIRRMEPSHIRRFHADHYKLGHMGMVVAMIRLIFPEMSL